MNPEQLYRPVPPLVKAGGIYASGPAEIMFMKRED